MTMTLYAVSHKNGVTLWRCLVDFYRATAFNITHGIAVAILSVRPSVFQMRVL